MCAVRRIMLLIGACIVLAGCATTPQPEAVARTRAGSTPMSPVALPQSTTRPVLGDGRTRSRDGMAMVHVPAGQFEMGSSDAQMDASVQACVKAGHEADECRQAVYIQEQAAHTVVLDAFWMDRTEVNNAMFAAFLNAQDNQSEEGVRWLEPGAGSRGVAYGHIEEHNGVFQAEPGYEEYPAIEVSWYGAAAYCAWVGGRLPTEAEWEYAARGPQSSVYPWGDTFDGTLTNYCDASCTERWRDAAFDDGLAQWGPADG